MFLLLGVLIKLLFSIYDYILLFIFLGCDSKYFFDLIEGAWGEQPDLETSPQTEDEPVPKSLSLVPPCRQLLHPRNHPSPIPHLPSILYPLGKSELWLVFPAINDPSYELWEGDKKKYYCLTCGNSTGNHDSALTHVCRDHLTIVLSCHYCNFSSPSFSTLRKHINDKHAGLPVQVAPSSEESKFETVITLPQ